MNKEYNFIIINAIALVLGLCLTVPAFALEDSPTQTPSPQWFTCDKDEDCVYVGELCSSAAVNRVFADEAERYFVARGTAIDCAERCVVDKNTGKCLQIDRKEAMCQAHCCKLVNPW